MQYGSAVLTAIFGIGWISNSSVFEWREGGVFLRPIPENIAYLLGAEGLAALQTHPTGNPDFEPVLPVPFNFSQFRTFLTLHPLMRDSIESDYGVLVAGNSDEPPRCVPDDEALEALAAINAAAGRLVRLVVAGATEDVDAPMEPSHRAADCSSATAVEADDLAGDQPAAATTNQTLERWDLRPLVRADDLRRAICAYLKDADKTVAPPTASAMLSAWLAAKPSGVLRVKANEVDFMDELGREKHADLEAIAERMKRCITRYP